MGDHVPSSAVPVERSPTPVGGVLGRVLSMAPGKVAILHGPRGVGKSTLMLDMFPGAWICSDEMEPEQVLAYTARQGVRHGGISVPRWNEEAQRFDLGVRDPWDGRPYDLCFDSATSVGHDLEALQAVQARCRELGTRGLVILQQTKDGDARGDARLTFMCDVEIQLSVEQGERRAEVRKNRGGPEVSICYRLGPRGLELPRFDGYYSIEGEGGRYELVRHPAARRRRYAGLLRSAEASAAKGEPVELPPPPLAVCALRSALYRGGWVEPHDVEERERFASAHGVPYFSPTRSVHGH